MYKIPANTLFVGKNLVFVPECHSTNDLALLLSQEGSTSEGTVVITDCQTSGRGQRGNTWEGVKGFNFTLSLILKPSMLAIQDQFYLNLFTSLAILDYLKENTDAPVQIKWPNDVLINGKKICGILIENQLAGGRFSNSVIGIGLNMNQKSFSVSMATSLSLITGKEFKLEVELEQLLHRLESRYVQLRQHQYGLLMKDYLDNMYWLNENHIFSTLGVEFEGKITGIDSAGRLTIQTHEGLRSFDLKEVIYIK